ncbi:MAG TPA: hypothetical protein VLR94_03255 [Acidobacteriota bacterium]|nr:hypothetical protein [Acidobacteriota bacterium]
MSFPDYLRERISEDYKNLIIQKLEEVKRQSEGLRDKMAPTMVEANQSLKERLQREFTRIQETIEAELSLSQERVASELNEMLDDSSSGWYHSDLSPYGQQLDILISDIVSNVPPPPKKENAGLASLLDLTKKLDAGNTQSEILNIVLHHISAWVDRAVLFVVKGDQATGWAAFGLGLDWDTLRIRQIRVDLNQDHVLRQVVNTGEAAYGAADQYSQNQALYSLIGDIFPAASLAFPIMVRGKIAGILYADTNDDLTEQPDLPNLLFLAARSAGSAIDLLAMKPKAAAAPAPPPPKPAMVTQPVIVQAPAPQTKEDARPTLVEEAAPTVMVTVHQLETPPQVVEETEGTVIMPAPARLEPAVISEEDQKLHDDAKRFARLLVSEIKLYNEAQVSAGRENKDLYERLKDDIERSRKMYQDRVPYHIHSTTNYFYEELVRTLANGDPTQLGM